jgi:hypothetical protein
LDERKRSRREWKQREGGKGEIGQLSQRTERSQIEESERKRLLDSAGNSKTARQFGQRLY